MNELTDKQKEEIKKLKKEAGRMGFGIGARAGFKLGFMLITIMLVNAYLVNNDLFLMLMGFSSGVFVFTAMRKESQEANAELQQRVKDILEIK